MQSISTRVEKTTILDQVRLLLEHDLRASDQFIISELESKIPMVKDILEYVLSCGGKRIRPMVLLLTARAIQSEPSRHVDLAAVIELIHTATLLHDDVVDDSTLRRGHQTAHMLWGSEASVLVGDFLYSRAFQIVVNFRHQLILDIFAQATHYIAEGEIMQLVNAHKSTTDQTLYFEIIQRKTAKLFEVAAQLGALVAGADHQTAEQMAKFGLHFGLAYQLIDDAIDYSDDVVTAGKNVGQDLDEGKMTMPLIYALEKSPQQDRAIITKAIEDGSSDNIKPILQILKKTKAIEYTAEMAKLECNKAKTALAILPESDYRNAMLELCDFVVQRNF